MSRWTGVLGLLALLGGLGPAFAESPPAECTTQATTVEMVICSDWHLTQADALLNQTYGELQSDMDDAGNVLLRDAQRAWITFRDAECSRVADSARGGTLSRILEVSCRQYFTAVRARQLVDSKGLESAPFPAFERPDSTSIGDFDCDGDPDLAILALVPLAPPNTELLSARLTIGEWTGRFPVGGNGADSLCTGEVLMSMVPSFDNPSCPMVRIDDGACDAMFVIWNDAAKDFEWFRN